MIIINSKKHSECNLIIKSSIKNILNNEEKYVVLLIDELYEFIDLIDEFDGKKIFCNFLTNPKIEELVEENIKLYAIYLDCPIEYSLNEIKRIENMVKLYGYEPLTIFKSTDDIDIEFIKNNYDKNFEEDFEKQQEAFLKEVMEIMDNSDDEEDTAIDLDSLFD